MARTVIVTCDSHGDKCKDEQKEWEIFHPITGARYISDRCEKGFEEFKATADKLVNGLTEAPQATAVNAGLSEYQQRQKEHADLIAATKAWWLKMNPDSQLRGQVSWKGDKVEAFLKDSAGKASGYEWDAAKKEPVKV